MEQPAQIATVSSSVGAVPTQRTVFVGVTGDTGTDEYILEDRDAANFPVRGGRTANSAQMRSISAGAAFAVEAMNAMF